MRDTKLREALGLTETYSDGEIVKRLDGSEGGILEELKTKQRDDYYRIVGNLKRIEEKIFALTEYLGLDFQRIEQEPVKIVVIKKGKTK